MSVTAVPLQPVKGSYKLWIWLGVLAAAAIAFALAWSGTRTPVSSHLDADGFLAWHKNQPGIQTTASGLQYQVIEAGSGATPAEQDGVVLEVRGTTRDGKEFQPKMPLRYQIGQQQMIPGFSEGVKLMKKGSRYRFWLPPKLGYGAGGGQQNELSDQVLIFDVNMQELVPAAVIRQMMQQQGAIPQGAGDPAAQ